jgi:hypothetical protein
VIIVSCAENGISGLSPGHVEMLTSVSVHLLIVRKVAEMYLVSVGLDGERECAFTAIFQAISYGEEFPAGGTSPGCL